MYNFADETHPTEDMRQENSSYVKHQIRQIQPELLYHNVLMTWGTNSEISQGS
jgi:hypothetical protein